MRDDAGHHANHARTPTHAVQIDASARFFVRMLNTRARARRRPGTVRAHNTRTNERTNLRLVSFSARSPGTRTSHTAESPVLLLDNCAMAMGGSPFSCWTRSRARSPYDAPDPSSPSAKPARRRRRTIIMQPPPPPPRRRATTTWSTRPHRWWTNQRRGRQASFSLFS